MSEQKETWRLASIKIEFKRGYNFDKSVDRYEGKICFENGEEESFSFKVRPDMAADYISIMSKDIVRAAESLGQRLVESLKLPKQ